MSRAGRGVLAVRRFCWHAALVPIRQLHDGLWARSRSALHGQEKHLQLPAPECPCRE